jgi:SAM-dependent methyltransferase
MTTLSSRAPRCSAATDWDRYYGRPAKAAAITRRITATVIARQFQRWAPPRPRIAELGGANSCFLDTIAARFHSTEYHVIDTNQFGLDMLRRRKGLPGCVKLHCHDVLDLSLPIAADVVLSIGLIEHFDPEDTARAVRAHFRLVRPGGIVIIGFPTPTLLYRVARWAAERAGKWIFHDERPLEFAEVAAAVGDQGQLLSKRILWPLVFTQYLTVWGARR